MLHFVDHKLKSRTNCLEWQ